MDEASWKLASASQPWDDVGGEIESTAAFRPSASKTTKKRGRGNWTPQDDEVLQEAVARFDAKRWKDIAKYAFGDSYPQRTAVQCRQRWKSVLDRGLVKGRWTREEDERLMQLVANSGVRKIKWAAIAKGMPGRLGKQCRERWYSYLAPNVNTAPYTEEEEATILRLHQTFGTAWSKMREHLPGRTDNSIKNQYHIIINRSRSQSVREKPPTEPKWTIDEEVTLVQQYKIHGTQWEAIARHLPGRSAATVQARFNMSISHILTENETYYPSTNEMDQSRRDILRKAYLLASSDWPDDHQHSLTAGPFPVKVWEDNGVQMSPRKMKRDYLPKYEDNWIQQLTSRGGNKVDGFLSDANKENMLGNYSALPRPETGSEPKMTELAVGDYDPTVETQLTNQLHLSNNNDNNNNQYMPTDTQHHHPQLLLLQHQQQEEQQQPSSSNELMQYAMTKREPLQTLDTNILPPPLPPSSSSSSSSSFPSSSSSSSSFPSSSSSSSSSALVAVVASQRKLSNNSNNNHQNGRFLLAPPANTKFLSQAAEEGQKTRTRSRTKSRVFSEGQKAATQTNKAVTTEDFHRMGCFSPAGPLSPAPVCSQSGRHRVTSFTGSESGVYPRFPVSPLDREFETTLGSPLSSPLRQRVPTRASPEIDLLAASPGFASFLTTQSTPRVTTQPRDTKPRTDRMEPRLSSPPLWPTSTPTFSSPAPSPFFLPSTPFASCDSPTAKSSSLAAKSLLQMLSSPSAFHPSNTGSSPNSSASVTTQLLPDTLPSMSEDEEDSAHVLLNMASPDKLKKSKHASIRKSCMTAGTPDSASDRLFWSPPNRLRKSEKSWSPIGHLGAFSP